MHRWDQTGPGPIGRCGSTTPGGVGDGRQLVTGLSGRRDFFGRSIRILADASLPFGRTTSALPPGASGLPARIVRPLALLRAAVDGRSSQKHR